MAITTRSTVVGFIEESSEAVLREIDSAGQYVATQDDFTLDASFESIENPEIQNSLAPGKASVGVENPTGSLSHNLRHSGVEGTPPSIGRLLKGIFGEEKILTEQTTAAGSTVSTLNVGTGIGANYAKGDLVLVKDPLNGFEARFIKSVSTDALTPLFNLPGAPASGVALGKGISYKPNDEVHPSYSFWQHVGRTGAVKAVSGVKVTEFSTSFEAGSAINATYSFEGIEFYFNPILITATTNKLDVTDDDGTFLVSVLPKAYKTPIELADALQTSLNAAGRTQTYSVVFNNKLGTFTISADGTVLSLLWSSGANEAETIGEKIGFNTDADDTGELSYTSDSEQSLAPALSPTYESEGLVIAKGVQVLFGNPDNTACLDSATVSYTVSNERSVQSSLCSESGRAGSLMIGRTSTITITAFLEKHEVETFEKFRKNEEVACQVVAGRKEGGQFKPGSIFACCITNASISELLIGGDQEGISTLEITINGFGSEGGETFAGYL